MGKGLDFSNQDIQPCVSYIQWKQNRRCFPKNKSKTATGKLEPIHTDICGPMNTKSWNGSKYLLTFIDDFAQKTFGYFLKSKDAGTVPNIFKHFKILVESQTHQRIKTVHSDNGKEYINDKFQEYLQENRIAHQTTVE
jgi:transposase InsO family protein